MMKLYGYNSDVNIEVW